MAANATAVWRVRPSGNDNNGGGYDAGIAGAGTDFSQQNAAQVTQSGGTVSTATVTLTDTGASFTSALIGNGIRVSGTGFSSPFFTFVTAVPSGTTLTLQTSPGTTGTAVTYSIGGGWLTDVNAIQQNGNSPVVPGNTVFFLGSGTPNPSSYVYDIGTPPGGGGYGKAVGGNATAGYVTWANDPSTPGYKAPPDTTGGMPTFQLASLLQDASANYIKLKGLYLINSGPAVTAYGFVGPQGGAGIIEGCVFDTFGFDSSACALSGGNTVGNILIGCEIFSSVAAGAGTLVAADNSSLIGCNVHDTVGPGPRIFSGTPCVCDSTIIAKCAGSGVLFDYNPNLVFGGSNAVSSGFVRNCTIDGNTGHGIEFASQQALALAVVYNNIISNQTGGGKFGMTVDAGASAANNIVQQLVDYNSFYNNTANYNAISAGPHDTALGVTPYVNSATENYTLA